METVHDCHHRRSRPRRHRRRARTAPVRGRRPRPGRHVPTWALSLAGVALTFLAGNRGGSALVAWIAPIPLALAATRLRGWRGRLGLLAICVAALSLQSLKMVTPPVTAPFALVFGVPLGAVAWTTLVLWDGLRRRAGAAWSIPAFAALTALADVAGAVLSPAGHWASTAASQPENLPLLQVASLGGLGLVGLVMALPIGAGAALLATPAPHRPWRTAVAAVAIAVAAHAWGGLRLQAPVEGPTLRVAGVTVDFPEPLTSMEDLRGREELLFARSELAARRGAQLILWNEVATIVDPGPEEAALLARGADLARAHGVDLVLAYGVVLGRSPFLIDNVYVWLGPAGETLERYQKHALPPGEPSVRGTAPLRVLERPWGRAAGALCYDYDFPALARQHARGGAGLVALPSSDWRGIDPQHTVHGAGPRHRGRDVGGAGRPGLALGRLRRLRPRAGHPARLRAERAGHAGHRPGDAGPDPLRGLGRRPGGAPRPRPARRRRARRPAAPGRPPRTRAPRRRSR